jgi:hypothetical protein
LCCLFECDGADHAVPTTSPKRQDRVLVYEHVLAEGTDDDVRRFVDIDDLVELWPDLVLPHHVRRAWADWLLKRRGIAVPC